MTALARLKPEPVDANLARLGALVEAVQARLAEPGVEMVLHDRRQREWAEAVALASSIAEDDGWLLYVTSPNDAWRTLYLHLDAPQLFLRSPRRDVEVWPRTARWSASMCAIVEDAKRARAKRLGKDVPLYTDEILLSLRAKRWARWGRP